MMQPKKRTRASHPKVRTGCHTCKARRVKCDEQRPSCQKCLNTGRKCEGYKNNREWVVVVAPPPPVTDGFEDDRSRRHFDYFRTQAIYELSWFFDGCYWGNLVLQESHASPAVRHAVIALACSHEDFRDSFKHALQAPQYAYAAQHYSKSIRNLIKETSDDAQESRLRALMCGLLFISIEVLRGNNAAALHHLDGCLKIVQEAQARSGMTSLEGNYLESEAHLFRDVIPMYERLDIQSALMLGRTPEHDDQVPILWDEARDTAAEDPPSLNFHTTLEALEYLYWLGNRVHDFTGWYPGHYRRSWPRPNILTEKAVLSDQFMQWENAIQSLMDTPEFIQNYDRIVLMRIHQRTMITLLESSLDVAELLLDEILWAFEDIVNYTAELQDRPFTADDDSSNDSDSSLAIGSTSGRSFGSRSARSRTTTPLPGSGVIKKQSRPLFILDSGLIFSLFWTALKCRDGLVRRRAISLLESSHQEGVWIGPIQANIAKRIVEIEEGQPYEQYPPFEQLKQAEDVPEYMRVHNVTTDINKPNRTAKLVILQRMDGSEGEWCEAIEWVTW